MYVTVMHVEEQLELPAFTQCLELLRAAMTALHPLSLATLLQMLG